MSNLTSTKDAWSPNRSNDEWRNHGAVVLAMNERTAASVVSAVTTCMERVGMDRSQARRDAMMYEVRPLLTALRNHLTASDSAEPDWNTLVVRALTATVGVIK